MKRALAALLMCVATAAGAQDAAPPQTKVCNLPLIASLDFTTTPQGMISLPGAVDDHAGGFLVDTGGVSAVLGLATAKRLRNPVQRSNIGEEFIGGTRLDFGVRVDRFQLGSFPFQNVWFLVAPERMMDPDMIGELQPHALSGVNFEIDFLKGKFNLFQASPCPGHEVYWTHDAFAQVPMEVDPYGHIVVKAILDGKSVDAVIDTGSQSSNMSLKTARRVFGIDEKNPALKSLGTANLNNMVETSNYRYPFAALTFEGVEIKNPDIQIDDAGKADTHDAQLIVGIGVLRQLHLFIAYDEKTLYLTTAEAR